MCGCGGGGVMIDANEMRRQTETNERLSMRMLDQSDRQFDYFMGRQEGIDRTAEEVARRQLEMAEETQAQGRDLYEYQKEVFRPVEQTLVSQAMRDSTPEFYEKYAQEAMARQAQANQNAMGQMERSLASMGVNPNSGAYQSQMRGLQIQNAALMGASANDAYDRAEALGWARRADVAGLGKGLVGAGNASYGIASGANNAATGAMNAANAQAAGALGTPTQYGQLGMQGMSNVMNTYADIYKTGLQMQAAENNSMWGALGSAAGLAAYAAIV